MITPARLLFLILLVGAVTQVAPEVLAAEAGKPRFRLHLFSEPSSLSPFVQKNSGSLYLLAQLSCPLLKSTDSGSRPWGAHCEVKKQTVTCEIEKSLRFQTGENVTAEHYRKSFVASLNPQKPSPRAELLTQIHNAWAVLQGEKPVSELGIKATGNRLVFSVDGNPGEFLLTLANPLFTAVKDAEIPTREEWRKFSSCGPYQIENWAEGKKIQLVPNPHFPLGHPGRPDLEYLFIPEDGIALQAYQKGELDFLRRLPTLYLGQWENSPELRKVDQIRFDFLGLSAEFRDPHLAEALGQAIDYEAWQKLYHAKPRPGCFGIPDTWTKGRICWDFNPLAAKAALAKMQKDPRLAKLRLFYSKQGGDDHDRTMEFLQDQWRKNLGLEIKVEGQENKIFLETLNHQGAPFFRKGLSPERASCLAVLENFIKGAPENYLQWDDSRFKELIEKMRAPSKDPSKLCREGVLRLKDQGLLIPTGRIYFSLLLKPGWQGLELNSLNQLDLSGLHRN